MNTLIIFVHGLGGGTSTWGDFPKLIRTNTELNVSFCFMGYPSPPLGIKLSNLLQQKYQSIEDLAKSLRTLIENKCEDENEIVLVGHSMGGLIIKKYLLEEKGAGRKLKVSKAILYAVPNRGASLAWLIKQVSLYANPHLLQLRKGSDFIKQLNESWRRYRVEDDVDVTVVVAGNDKIVSEDSAEGAFLYSEPEQIAGVGHLDIVKPKTSADMSFVILKNVLLKKKYIPKLQLQGSCDFIGWQKYSKLSKFAFRLDEKRQIIFDALMLEFSQAHSILRLKGLSGLGKTRLTYEAVLASSQDIKNKVLYINVASENPGIASWLKRAIDSGYEGILIVDNCKPELHKDLSNEVGRDDCKILLITLDHSLDSLPESGTKEYKIEQLAQTQIKAMLEPEYGNRIQDLDRVAAFAQGFPQMAVLIADARLSNDPQVGKLRDDELAKKLLGKITETETSILKGCSLFDRFGLEGDISEEYKYIADNIVKVLPSEFYKCVKKFQERGLIDISGRYGQLVPKPLAVRLASEWWIETHKEVQLAFLKDIPSSLVEPFCLQVTMLGFIPEVQDLTKALCGPQGPFGEAEAILSNRGSRLLRSFVEVNPVATSSALYDVLIKLSNKDLANIAGEIRRNLVIALEKLVFHARVFEESAWSLMLLASAENETWSNNATGMFVQLFRVNLSGTEADFELRLHFLKRAIDLNDNKVDKVVIQALGASINTYGGHRTVGAEYQGSGSPLKEWRPKLWQEIFDYWNIAFEMLVNFVERRNENSREAQNIIGHSIRGMISQGRIEMLNNAISRVVKLNGRYWPAALESIKHSLEYDSKGMPEEGVIALNNWLDLLSPDEKNLAESLQILVVSPPWEHREDEDGQYLDIAEQNAEQLAVKLSQNVQQLAEFIPLLLTGEQRQSYSFGRRLALELKDINDFMKLVINEIVQIENPNLSFAQGILSGIHTNSTADWNYYLEEFSSQKELVKYYPAMLCTGRMQHSHLSKLLELIRHGELRSDSATIFGYGRATEHLGSNEISEFCLKLAEIDSIGAWTALGIMFMYCFGNTQKFEENRASLKTLVIKVPLNNKASRGHSDMYHWDGITKKLLATEGLPFCEHICRQIISAANDNFDHGDIWHYIKPLLIEMMKSYGKDIWPIFGSAIIAANSTQKYWLQQLLEREDSFSNVQQSVFSILPLDVVIQWCKENLEVAPYFVARAINVFEQDSDGLKRPTALFVSLLENFGELAEFGSELSANLGSKGWTGSLVPYLQSDKSALEPLLQHADKNVRSWVRNYIDYLDKYIAHESMREEEGRLGNY